MADKDTTDTDTSAVSALFALLTPGEVLLHRAVVVGLPVLRHHELTPRCRRNPAVGTRRDAGDLPLGRRALRPRSRPGWRSWRGVARHRSGGRCAAGRPASTPGRAVGLGGRTALPEPVGQVEACDLLVAAAFAARKPCRRGGCGDLLAAVHTADPDRRPSRPPGLRRREHIEPGRISLNHRLPAQQDQASLQLVELRVGARSARGRVRALDVGDSVSRVADGCQAWTSGTGLGGLACRRPVGEPELERTVRHLGNRVLLRARVSVVRAERAAAGSAVGCRAAANSSWLPGGQSRHRLLTSNSRSPYVFDCPVVPHRRRDRRAASG